jgi:hypothetical protein
MNATPQMVTRRCGPCCARCLATFTAGVGPSPRWVPQAACLPVHWRASPSTLARDESRQWHLAAFAVAIGLLLAFVSGCAPMRDARLRDDVQRPARSVVVFFPDGMDERRMEELLAEGRLPNIRKRFFEGGVRVRHAVSSLPSSTYPNSSSVITGRFPGHHHIMGNFWFDRRTLECRDYMSYSSYLTVNDHLAVPTLYDLLSDRLTVSIAHHTHKGVTTSINNDKVFFWAWALGDYRMADSRAGLSVQEVIPLANRVGRWPSVLLTYHPGVDEIGHRCGTNSARYARALATIDRVVGEVTGFLEQQGLGESVVYILVTDHGMVPASQSIDILDWIAANRRVKIRRQGIKADDYGDRQDLMAGYDDVGGIDAGRVAMVHLRSRRGWPYRPESQEALDFVTARPPLHELPCVEVVLLRDGADRVRVFSKAGTAGVERRSENGQKQYRLAEYQGDPLEYLADASLAAFVRGGWHSSHEWLEATAASRFPDFVSQAVELFDSPRTGDVVIMSADDWLLYRRGEHAGHGSCLARDMRIPLFFSGPGLPKGAEIDHARLVDVMPTILGLLGESDRLKLSPPIDGIDLSPQLRSAR